MELIQKEFCLLVPVDKAGLLLGTKGSTIETIRYSSGCQVKMYKDKLPYSDERIFYIPGREGKELMSCESEGEREGGR